MAATYSGHHNTRPPVISPGTRNVPGGFLIREKSVATLR